MGVFPSQPRRGLLGFGLTLWAAGCIQPPPSPAANVCPDPLPNAGGVGDGAGGGDAGSAGLRHTSPPGPVPSWLRQREQQQVFPVLPRVAFRQAVPSGLPSWLSGRIGNGAAPGEREKPRVRHWLALFIFHFDSRSFN